MTVTCLDLEGVLVPEIWPAIADETGIDALRLTTRDLSNYDELMQHRLAVLAKHEIGLSRIRSVISLLKPFAGATDFLCSLKRKTAVIILSDTFTQFADPLMEKLDYPVLLCNELCVQSDRIVDYRLRQPDGKRAAVEAFQSLNLKVLAAGDSHNDLTMLRAADAGMLFRAPTTIRAANSDLPACEEYADLLAWAEQKQNAACRVSP